MRLWLKILLSTAAVVLLCLVITGVLAGVLIRRGFDRFVQAQEQNYVQRLIPSLANYYQRTGSWAGLDEILGVRRGQGMGQGMMGAGSGMRLILLDANRRVVLDTQEVLVAGQRAPADVWNAGTPIEVGGQEVGRLTSGAALTGARNRSAIEGTFLGSLGWVLALAGLAGFAAAAIAATLLALQITAPARDLTRAARRIAAGDRDQRVNIRSGDELGEVGTAFNDMAAALAQQEELRRHLVADVAHELRTPLAVMKVEMESLQDGLTQPTPEAIASLGEEVGLLSRLVEDLRLLSLMDAGQLPLQHQPVALAEGVQKAVQQTTTAAERKEVTLEMALPPDLPRVRADPDRLQQVLLNLLNNALRHTPAGGAVRLAAQVEGTYVHLQVADTGEGIEPQDLPHIFDRFYRADASRSRATGGSGLGLTIARGLVEAMGGRIWAESALDQGTTIHFTVPVAS
jgi:signal transduction histidine kinase